MTDKRKSPPLFDLMRERERAANAPDPMNTPNHPPPPRPAPPPPAQHQAPPVPEPKPVNGPKTRPTAWDSTGGVSRAERSAATMLDDAPQSDSALKIPRSMAYLAVAVMLAVGVLAWAGGHHFGVQAGKAQMEGLIQDQPVVRPMVRSPEPTTPAASSQAPESGTGSEPVSTINGVNPSAPGMAIMSASGFLKDDPREIGTNYLELATLARDEAMSAIGFMNGRGVPVIGIPRLDSRRSDANNPSRYTLYSLGVAAPGDQFRTMTRERDDHQEQIADLGRQWQRESRGGSDFAVSRTQWVKYAP